MTRINCFMMFSILTMLFIPPELTAANFISLSDQEMMDVTKGDVVAREVKTGGTGGRTVEAVGLVASSRISLLKILQDYKKYPEFMPNVSSIEIVEQREFESVVDYTLALPLGKIKKYRLKISAGAAGDNKSILQWVLLKRPELKPEETIADTSGFWRIEEKGDNLSLVLYHVYSDPGPVPFGLGWIVDALSRKGVPDVVRRTRIRAESMSR